MNTLSSPRRSPVRRSLAAAAVAGLMLPLSLSAAPAFAADQETAVAAVAPVTEAPEAPVVAEPAPATLEVPDPDPSVVEAPAEPVAPVVEAPAVETPAAPVIEAPAAPAVVAPVDDAPPAAPAAKPGAHIAGPIDVGNPDEDTDTDGLTNAQEISLGLNPLLTDTDGDSLSDGDEILRGTNPFRTDTDRDGLSDSAELARGTLPGYADSDGDRITDGAEVNEYHTNPLRKDTDRDNLWDYAEITKYHTNPLRKDSAKVFAADPSTKAHPRAERPNIPIDGVFGDGILDGLDVSMGLDVALLGDLSSFTATPGDADGDGWLDSVETTYHSDTESTDSFPASRWVRLNKTATGGGTFLNPVAGIEVVWHNTATGLGDGWLSYGTLGALDTDTNLAHTLDLNFAGALASGDGATGGADFAGWVAQSGFGCDFEEGGDLLTDNGGWELVANRGPGATPKARLAAEYADAKRLGLEVDEDQVAALKALAKRCAAPAKVTPKDPKPEKPNTPAPRNNPTPDPFPRAGAENQSSGWGATAPLAALLAGFAAMAARRSRRS